jgi:YD repeat-containing protein
VLTIFASVAYAYDKAGNVTTGTLDDALTYCGDAVVTYAYDDAYRLTREKCTPGGGSSRMAYDYRYYFDGVGNRTKFIRTDLWTSDRTVVYEYSARNELTRYSDPEGSGKYWVCEYDLRGNRTKWRHSKNRNQEPGVRSQNAGGRCFAYGRNANLQSRAG